MVRKLRLLAADFRASFDDMARQSELDDLRKEVEALRHTSTDVLKDLPTFEELSADLTATPSAAPYDDTQDKLDAGFAPETAALTVPDPAPTILPAAKKASRPSAKGVAKPASKAVPKAAAKPAAKPKAKAKSATVSGSKA
jgi:sec-independent protein translocase protein TatB